jgi:hypothetical protein
MNSPLVPSRHLPPGPPAGEAAVRSTLEAEVLLGSDRLQVN